MKPRVLCVDDEPAVLDGLKLQLRREFAVVCASGGHEGLEHLTQTEFAVVISDMRMPRMNGAAFLSAAREGWPFTTRLLLTGQSDMESAIAAVNDGQIFRFLTKPCTPDRLRSAVRDASEMNRLVRAEKTLLEETLHGSIEVLSDVLAMTQPEAFAGMARIAELIESIADDLELERRWELLVANVFRRVALATLTTETIEKIVSSRVLTADETRAVEALPAVAAKLVKKIPRLEGVCALLHLDGKNDERQRRRADASLVRRAGVLTLAQQFVQLEREGLQPADALRALEARGHERELLDTLQRICEPPREPGEVRELSLSELTIGMRFMRDVLTSDGRLLLARGHILTEGVRNRLFNLGSGAVREPLMVAEPR